MMIGSLGLTIGTFGVRIGSIGLKIGSFGMMIGSLGVLIGFFDKMLKSSEMLGIMEEALDETSALLLIFGVRRDSFGKIETSIGISGSVIIGSSGIKSNFEFVGSMSLDTNVQPPPSVVISHVTRIISPEGVLIWCVPLCALLLFALISAQEECIAKVPLPLSPDELLFEPPLLNPLSFVLVSFGVSVSLLVGGGELFPIALFDGFLHLLFV